MFNIIEAISKEYPYWVILSIEDIDFDNPDTVRKFGSRITNIMKSDFEQIRKYATKHKLEIIKIDPRHTSMTCTYCNRTNPKSKKKYLTCIHCHTTFNRDTNASKVIASRGQDTFIYELIQPWIQLLLQIPKKGHIKSNLKLLKDFIIEIIERNNISVGVSLGMN